MFVLVWSQVQHGSGSINHMMITIQSIGLLLISVLPFDPITGYLCNRDPFHTLRWRLFQFNNVVAFPRSDPSPSEVGHHSEVPCGKSKGIST